MSALHDIRAGRLSTNQLADNFTDLHAPLTAHQAAVESSRCLFCHDAPCMEACPTGIDIPGFIRKINSGNTRGAAITILSENIMGGTCANVCPVEELCEEVCVRNAAEDSPVEIGRLQRYATDALFASGVQPFQRSADSGKHIAVVGAGPAGLSCAHRLAMHGHQVTIFEAREKGGGLNEYGIAAYKMTDQRAAREVAFILGIGGITLKCGRRLGEDIHLAQLCRDFDAVFLGMGLASVNTLGLENETLPGVMNAVDYIEEIRQKDLASLSVGRRVVVIGGGNTAIDIALQTRKLGAEEVTLVYRRSETEMSATWFEQQLVQSHGVLIRTMARPCKILGDAQGVSAVEFEITEYDDEDQLRGSGRRFTLNADMLFKAIGQCMDELTDCEIEGGRIKVDEHGASSVSGVYAGGDCVAGIDLTVAAVEDGKRAAEAMHQFLMENGDG